MTPVLADGQHCYVVRWLTEWILGKYEKQYVQVRLNIYDESSTKMYYKQILYLWIFKNEWQVTLHKRLLSGGW